MIQTPESYGSYNKRIISEIDSMEVDEEISNKKNKIQSQGEIIMHVEQNLSDSRKSDLLQQNLYK